MRGASAVRIAPREQLRRRHRPAPHADRARAAAGSDVDGHRRGREPVNTQLRDGEHFFLVESATPRPFRCIAEATATGESLVSYGGIRPPAFTRRSPARRPANRRTTSKPFAATNRASSTSSSGPCGSRSRRSSRPRRALARPSRTPCSAATSGGRGSTGSTASGSIGMRRWSARPRTPASPSRRSSTRPRS